MPDTHHLYHCHERGQPPFRTLTSLPMEEAKVNARKILADMSESFISGFLQRRYERDQMLRGAFLAIGGKPVRSAPVYFTLGPNEGMKTWFDDPVQVKIPVSAFDPDTVSFTYGDSFAVFNPALDTGEEWWGRVYRYDEILRLIDARGFPEDPPYHMRKRVFPEGRPINHILKFVEAHVWSDEVLERYR